MKWFPYLKVDSQEKIKKLNKLKLPVLDSYNKEDLKYLFLFFQDYFKINNNFKLQRTQKKQLSKDNIKYIGGEITLKGENIEFETSYTFKNHKFKYYHSEGDISYHNLCNQRIFTMFEIYNRKKILDLYVVTNDKNRFLNKRRSNNIKFDLNDMKKKGIANISSGVTTYQGKMVVSRKEELPKLLVHELIHFLGLDGDFFNFNHTELFNAKENFTNYNITSLCVQKNISSFVYESYTEFLSNILNCLFTSLEIPNGNFSTMIETLELERIYSIYQTAKLLYYFGFNNFNSFFLDCKNKLNSKNRRFFTDTLYLDYTIIRSIMFFSFQEVLDIMDIKNNMLQIKNKKNNFYNQLQQIINHTVYGNRKYADLLDYFLKQIPKINDLDIGYTCIDIDPKKYDLKIYGIQ
jgi:hypothetical protein